MVKNSAVFLWSQYSAMNALQIKKIGEMTSDDSKRRYLMGRSRYVSDYFSSGGSKTGDRSEQQQSEYIQFSHNSGSADIENL